MRSPTWADIEFEGSLSVVFHKRGVKLVKVEYEGWYILQLKFDPKTASAFDMADAQDLLPVDPWHHRPTTDKTCWPYGPFPVGWQTELSEEHLAKVS
ncbi:hypothetical protein ABZV14_06020 [Streptosporangium canum]|uniref:hypothetical protein n=1 Tax=Streptosporangium canum TaxID=324952 RepID=UPI00339FFA99